MNDLVRREEIINIIHNKIQSTSDFLQHDVLIDVEFEVNELPIVEVGEWCKGCDFDNIEPSLSPCILCRRSYKDCWRTVNV